MPPHRPRAAALAAAFAAAALALPSAAPAQSSLTVSVDPTTFFDDEPGWLLAARAELGFDDDGALWPQLGAGFGYAFPSHLLLAAWVDGRLTEPYHVRTSFRVGGLFRRKVLDIGFGTALSLLAVPQRREIGPVPTAWFELRLRLRHEHALSLHLEGDALIEQLGFDENRGHFGVGLGWSVLF